MVKSLDFVHIHQFTQLSDQLIEAFIFLDAKPDAASAAISNGMAEDAVHVEGTPGEESGDMGENARVIGDGQLQDVIHGFSVKNN